MARARTVLILALSLLIGCVGSEPSPPSDPQFDWSISKKVRSPDGSVDAVLEVGAPKGVARTMAVKRISIQAVDAPDEWGHHWSVWESQVSEPPSVVWAQPHRLVITHRPYLVLEYEPEVTIRDRTYAVDLSITRSNN